MKLSYFGLLLHCKWLVAGLGRRIFFFCFFWSTRKCFGMRFGRRRPRLKRCFFVIATARIIYIAEHTISTAISRAAPQQTTIPSARYSGGDAWFHISGAISRWLFQITLRSANTSGFHAILIFVIFAAVVRIPIMAYPMWRKSWCWRWSWSKCWRWSGRV